MESRQQRRANERLRKKKQTHALKHSTITIEELKSFLAEKYVFPPTSDKDATIAKLDRESMQLFLTSFVNDEKISDAPDILKLVEQRAREWFTEMLHSLVHPFAPSPDQSSSHVHTNKEIAAENLRQLIIYPWPDDKSKWFVMWPYFLSTFRLLYRMGKEKLQRTKCEESRLKIVEQKQNDIVRNMVRRSLKRAVKLNVSIPTSASVKECTGDITTTLHSSSKYAQLELAKEYDKKRNLQRRLHNA